jgi:hypothetical protein
MTQFEKIGFVSGGMMSVHEVLHRAYGEPRPWLRQSAAVGYSGRMAGRSWRRYDDKGRRL